MKKLSLVLLSAFVLVVASFPVASGQAPPQFLLPAPAPCGMVFLITEGSTLTFTVSASDPDTGDVVTLSVGYPIGLPAGSPIPSFPTPPPSNPVSSTLSYTPPIGLAAGGIVGFVALFTATDNTNLSTTCLIGIKIVPPPPSQPVSKSFTLLTPTLPAGQAFVPLNTVLTWSVKYLVANIFSTPITSVVLKDHFAASLAVDTTTITFSAPAGSGAVVPSFTTSNGQQAQWSFVWSIGTLLPGQTTTLSVQVNTRINPAGQQEFTLPGLQILSLSLRMWGKWT